MSPDDDFSIITTVLKKCIHFYVVTTVTRRHPSSGTFGQVPIYASSLLTIQGPWMTFGSAHPCHTSHKDRLNRAPTQGTKDREPCSCAPTAQHVSMSNWIGYSTLSKRDINPFVCLQESQGRQTIACAP